MEISYTCTRHKGATTRPTQLHEDLMPIAYNHLETLVHPGRIVENWRKLEARGGHAYAVVKADAYGHGLREVARALAAAGAHTLCAGTVEESVSIRGMGYEGCVVSLLGPQLDEDFAAAIRHRIVPFIADAEQLNRLDAEAASLNVVQPISIKIDTGMGRLGFRAEDAQAVADLLDGLPHVKVAGVSSHLASADMPQDRAAVEAQNARFCDAVQALRSRGHEFEANLANSAALLAYPEMHHDAQRPGLALYGCNPFWGTEQAALGTDLVPAMDVRSRIYQTHGLRAGETVSYGRTFTAQRDMRIAVIAAGYADNYMRAMSGVGAVCVRGRRAPILGRVCMQMTAVDVTDIPDATRGDDVWLLGGPDQCAVRAEEFADWCGTISYEILCLLGQNPRRYA